jgi:23S rRNA (cytidine2498-2'-O)-methyltransferase
MWFLTTQENIIYCPQTNLPFPKGMVKFQESKIPPSRAYLKLWEVFTLHCQPPDRKSRVLDFGASPGGWTWVLNDLGCDILALDRSELHPNLMRLPNVEFRKCDAFSVKPSDIGPIDMFCSDIAAYPDKLFEYVNLWIQSGLCKRFICTIKLQGTESQWAKTGKYPWEPFTSIKGSRIVHLWNNKNELTWMYNISI